MTKSPAGQSWEDQTLSLLHSAFNVQNDHKNNLVVFTEFASKKLQPHGGKQTKGPTIQQTQ